MSTRTWDVEWCREHQCHESVACDPEPDPLNEPDECYFCYGSGCVFCMRDET